MSPVPDTSSPRTLRAVAHLDLDAFFVAVARLDDPTLVGRPVAVGLDVVASASYEARTHGVRSAMPISQARRLCADLVVVGVDLDRCRTVSDQVFDLVTTVHDDTAFERRSIDECYLEPAGPTDLARLADQVRATRELVARTLHVPVSAGIAPNKLVAKVASAAAKPAGQITVADPAGFLADRPPEVIPGVGPQTAERLNSLHLHTCAAVRATDPDLLAAWFPPRMVAWLQRSAAGWDDEPVTAPPPASSAGAQRALRPAVSDPAVLADVLDALAVEVATRPEVTARPPSALTVRLRDRRMSTRSRTTTLPVPSAHPWALAAAARVAAADLLAGEIGPVTLVAVTAEQLGSTARRQLRLLHPYDLTEFPDHLAALTAPPPRIQALHRAARLLSDTSVDHPVRGPGRMVKLEFPFATCEFASGSVDVDLDHARWIPPTPPARN